MKNFFLLVCITFIIFSCEKEVEISEVEPLLSEELIKITQADGSILNIKKTNGAYLMMGDIVLTEEQVENLKRNIEKGASIKPLARLWPNSVVYYRVNSSLPNTARVTDAINHYRAETPFITFVQRTNQPNYIEFVPIEGNVSYSPVGMTGGRQVIQVGNDTGLGVMIHEIGHSLGLFHEQARTDRNNFIRINYNNVRPGFAYAFDTYAQRGYAGFNHGTFDFNSRMLYSPYAFSDNGQPTITRLDGSLFFPNSSTLSSGDISVLDFLYNPAIAKLDVDSVGDYEPDGYWSESTYHVEFKKNGVPYILNAPLDLKYTLETRRDGETRRYRRSKTLQPGKSKYLIDTLFSQCYYDYGDPEPGCEDNSLYLTIGLGYRLN